MKKIIKVPAEILEQLESFPDIKAEFGKLMDDEGRIGIRDEVWNRLEREDDECMEMGMDHSREFIFQTKGPADSSSIHSIVRDEEFERKKTKVEMQLKGLKILSDSIEALNSIVKDERLERLHSRVEAKTGLLLMEKTMMDLVKF